MIKILLILIVILLIGVLAHIRTLNSNLCKLAKILNKNCRGKDD